MTLTEAIESITLLEGYVYHRLRATDHNGMVKCFTFWFESGVQMRDYEVRMLVKDEGLPTEEAHIYETAHLPNQPASFRDAVNTKIADFQISNPAYEKAYIQSCSEAREIAMIKAYEVTGSNVEEKTVVAYKKNGNIVLRILTTPLDV